MKKAILILLALLCLLSACQSQERSRDGVPFVFYYPTARPDGEQTLMAHTVYYPDELPEAAELLREYLRQQPPTGTQAAFPAGWQKRSVELQADGTLCLTLSGDEASPIDNSLAAACLSRTFLQLEGVSNLRLTLPGAEQALILTAEDVLFEDTAMLPQKEQLVLYYPDEALRYLQRETRTVEVMEDSQKPAYIVETLLAGSISGRPHPCIPEGTRLLSATVENGICTVDLSSAFSQNAQYSFASERLAIYSIVNSLTELEEIRSVEILVAHAPIERLYMMDLSNSLLRDERLLQGEGEDINIYPFADRDGRLLAVPITLEAQKGVPKVEQLLQTLLFYEDASGLQSCIPQGSKLLTVKLENGNCIIELSAEFLEQCASAHAEKLAVRAVIATVCELQDVRSVELLVEGLPPAFRNSTLANVHVPEKAWFSE